MEQINMSELPKPLGDWLLKQTDVAFRNFHDGAYWHYQSVLTLLKRYAAEQPPPSPVEVDYGNVEGNWENFWKGIVCNEDGTINLEQVKKELSDFYFVMGEVPKVYCHITGGSLSKLMYPSETVICVADDYMQGIIDRELKEAAEVREEESIDSVQDFFDRYLGTDNDFALPAWVLSLTQRYADHVLAGKKRTTPASSGETIEWVKAAELKECIVKHLLKNTQNVDTPYLVTGNKKYTQREIAHEISIESEMGIETITKVLMLALDLTARGKSPTAPASPSDTRDADAIHEKEIMIQAFDKVRLIFEGRQWITEGRGPYPYNDDRFKEEVRYMYDEFDALAKDTWANIRSKSVDYRKQIIDQYLKQTDTREEAIKFAEWADIYAVRNGTHKWTVGAGKDIKHYTTNQLYDLYTQSLNT